MWRLSRFTTSRSDKCDPAVKHQIRITLAFGKTPEASQPWCGRCSCPSRCRPACRSRPPLWNWGTPAGFVQHCPVFALSRARERRGVSGRWWRKNIRSHRLHARPQLNQSFTSQFPSNVNLNHQIFIGTVIFEESQRFWWEWNAIFRLFMVRFRVLIASVYISSGAIERIQRQACHRRAAWRGSCLKNGRRLKGSCPGEQRHTHTKKMRWRGKRRKGGGRGGQSCWQDQEERWQVTTNWLARRNSRWKAASEALANQRCCFCLMCVRLMFIAHKVYHCETANHS